ncbi:uncharacterized protein LOC135385518 [Ornithodoros turicata]|uniref:uncharacterized protein LOC135385518 n=1 Tax=Ornithodoros turicata TaxID=34597 RepID=UPI00313914A1
MAADGHHPQVIALPRGPRYEVASDLPPLGTKLAPHQWPPPLAPFLPQHSNHDVGELRPASPAVAWGQQAPYQVNPVTVPLGWRRCILQGQVVYFSPSNHQLWSLREVGAYLQTEGVCKCGLDCPLSLEQCFNFDPATPSRPQSVEQLTGNAPYQRKCKPLFPPNVSKEGCNAAVSMAMTTATTVTTAVLSSSAVVSTTVTSAAAVSTKPAKKEPTRKRNSRAKQRGPFDGVLVSQLLAQRDQLGLRKQTTGALTSLAASNALTNTTSSWGQSSSQQMYYNNSNHLAALSSGNKDAVSNSSLRNGYSQLCPCTSSNTPAHCMTNLQTSAVQQHHNQQRTPSPSLARPRLQRRPPRTRMPKLSTIISSRSVGSSINVQQQDATCSCNVSEQTYDVLRPGLVGGYRPNTNSGPPRTSASVCVVSDVNAMRTTCNVQSQQHSMMSREKGDAECDQVSGLGAPLSLRTDMTNPIAPAGSVMVQQLYSQKVDSYSGRTQIMQQVSGMMLPAQQAFAGQQHELQLQPSVFQSRAVQQPPQVIHNGGSQLVILNSQQQLASPQPTVDALGAQTSFGTLLSPEIRQKSDGATKEAECPRSVAVAPMMTQQVLLGGGVVPNVVVSTASAIVPQMGLGAQILNQQPVVQLVQHPMALQNTLLLQPPTTLRLDTLQAAFGTTAGVLGTTGTFLSPSSLIGSETGATQTVLGVQGYMDGTQEDQRPMVVQGSMAFDSTGAAMQTGCEGHQTQAYFSTESPCTSCGPSVHGSPTNPLNVVSLAPTMMQGTVVPTVTVFPGGQAVMQPLGTASYGALSSPQLLMGMVQPLGVLGVGPQGALLQNIPVMATTSPPQPPPVTLFQDSAPVADQETFASNPYPQQCLVATQQSFPSEKPFHESSIIEAERAPPEGTRKDPSPGDISEEGCLCTHNTHTQALNIGVSSGSPSVTSTEALQSRFSASDTFVAGMEQEGQISSSTTDDSRPPEGHVTSGDSGVESSQEPSNSCGQGLEVEQQVVEEKEGGIEEVMKQKTKRETKRRRRELLFLTQGDGRDDSEEEEPESPPLPPQPRTFDIGDVVWGQIKGFPSWPGKLVRADQVRGHHMAQDGKLWVQWFGDHTFTQVEPENLKTLSEGLEAHHRARKKYRRGRRLNGNLENAIQEAMMDLDRQSGMV